MNFKFTAQETLALYNLLHARCGDMTATEVQHLYAETTGDDLALKRIYEEIKSHVVASLSMRELGDAHSWLAVQREKIENLKREQETDSVDDDEEVEIDLPSVVAGSTKRSRKRKQ